MHKKRVIFLVRSFVAILFFFCGIISTESVFARTVSEVQKAIVDKAVYQGVYKCYGNGYINSSLDLGDYEGIGSLMNGNAKQDENYVPLPSGITSLSRFDHSRYKVSDDGLSCSQFFMGGSYGVTGGLNDNVLKATGHSAPNRGQTEEVKEFMKNMGYTVSSNGNGSSDCFSLAYETGDGEGVTNTVCRNDDGKLEVKGDVDKAFYFIPKSDGSGLCIQALYSTVYVQLKCVDYDASEKFSGDWLRGATEEICGGDVCGLATIKNAQNNGANRQENLNNYTAAFDSPSNAALKAIKFLSNGEQYSTEDSLKVSDIEKRILYQDYLTSYYNVEVRCDVNTDEVKKGVVLDWLDISNAKKPVMKKCIAYKDGDGPGEKKPDHTNIGKEVNGIDGSGYFKYHSIDNLDELINEFSTLKTEYSEEELDIATEVAESGIEGENPDAAKKTCKNSGGAKALGWVICPILEWVSDAVDGVYNEYVEPNLQLSPQLFANQDGTSGTREAWETFRNFANIAFIILLLVVIFSQLTGVGIDNYGIKKILPKLIVAAILINLSYLICMVLVDLSNIVGSGIRSLFSSLGAGVDGMSFGIDGGSTAGDSNFTLESTAITGVGILAAIGTVGAIFANPAILLSLLVSAIGVFISIFFLFILLAAREAAIIVLVILSPLAFVCYMLPNTKKLFDKWWKFFEGLLLVYPIIGLLVGGGDYVSRLLMNTGFADPAQGGSFITAFTAMIVGIIPIFFIPMVLKGSFAAMGKVGGMLTGLGARARGAATGAMRRTEGFQNAQKVGLERRGRLAAQRRAGGRIGEDGQFHERGLRGRFARTGLGRALGVDVQMGRARNEYVKGQIDRNSALDSLNPEIANYQLQQAQNARTQSAAEARAGAMPLTAELAQQRATSRRSAQELKAFQDQFAGYSQAQLREEANNAGAWLGQENGSQRMSALLQSMEANGMENDMARMLSNNDISNRSEVLQTLASSKNAVFSAYGKRASRPSLDANGNPVDNNVSFNDFMTGTGNATNTNQSMQAYLAEKGDDAIAKLDDKSLGMIANAQNTLTNSGSTEQIMSTNQLVEAASRINSEDSLEHVNNMLANRNDIRMSGEQLSNMNATTLTSLYGNASAERAIIQASDAIRNDAKLLNTVKAPSMTVINRIRTNNGHQGI